MLVHDDCGPAGGLVSQELEGQRRGYVVRNVRDTEVKVWELSLEEVPFDNLELLFLYCPMKAP
jgi:hypothetical protein